MSRKKKRQRTSSQLAKRIEAWNKAFRRFLPLSISRIVSPARDLLTRCFKNPWSSGQKQQAEGPHFRDEGTVRANRSTNWDSFLQNYLGINRRHAGDAVSRYEMHLETLEDRTLLSGTGFEDEIELDPVQPVDASELAIVSGTFTDGDGQGDNLLTIEWNDENADAEESVGTFALGAIDALSLGDSFQSTTDSSMLDIVSVNVASGQVGFWISGHEFADDSLSPEDPSIPDPTPIIVSITNSFSVTQLASLELLDEKAAGWNVVMLGEDPGIRNFRGIYGDENLLVANDVSRTALFEGTLNPATFSELENSFGDGLTILGIFGDKIIVNALQSLGVRAISAVSLADGSVSKLGDVQAVIAQSENPNMYAIPGKDYFLFVGSDSFGKELWRSDGTPENTFRLTDLYPGTASGISSLRTATVYNNELYFLARTNGSEPNTLYKTDGTEEGTVSIDGSLSVNQFAGIHGTALYFLGAKSGQQGLYRINGESGEAELLQAFSGKGALPYVETAPSSAGFFLVADDRGNVSPRLDHYDLATNTISAVYDFKDAPNRVFEITNVTAIEDGIVFWARANETGIPVSGPHEILVFREGTNALTSIYTGTLDLTGQTEVSQIAVKGDSLVWIDSGSSREPKIFVSYGTSESTIELEFDANGGKLGLASFANLGAGYVDPDGRLYFGLENGIDAGQLFSVVQTPVADSGQSRVIVTEGDAFALDASSTLDPENAIVLFEWDLNYDGQTFDVDALGNTVPFETMDGPAFSTVALRVTDAWGNASIDTQSILVRNVAPAITGLEDTSAALGETVSLSALVTDQGGNDTFSLEWNLGDGTIVNDATDVAHTYSAEGEYFASLTATDNDGGITVQEFRVVIGPAVELQLQNITPAEGGSGVIAVSFVDDIVIGEDVVIPLDFSGTANRDDFRLFANEALTIELENDSITIPAGQRSGEVFVGFLDDEIDEFEESLIVKMEVPSNASLSGASESTFNVTDNDPEPTVYLTGSSQILDESVGTVPVIARLSQVSGKDVVVDVGFGGTAVSGEDYLAPENQILIRAGELQAGLAVEIVDDELGESAEQLIVSINGVTNASQSADPLEPLSATHIISANDAPTIQFASVLQDVSETAGEFRVKVTLSNPADSEVSAQIDLSGTAILGSDYEYESPSQISFAAGDVEQTLVFSLTDDFEAELDETIIATLSGVTGALDGATLSHLARVIDDENLKVSVSTSAKSVWEDDDQFFVNARLSKATSVDVLVPVSFSSQLQSGSEYFVSSNQIVIRAGETSGQLAVILDADNQIGESDRSIYVYARDPENATLTGLRSLKVSILDNDPTVSFDPPPERRSFGPFFSSFGSFGGGFSQSKPVGSDITLDEDDGSERLTVYLDKAVNHDVTVPIRYSSPTMTSRDYRRGPSTVTIQAGKISASFEIEILDDAIDEAQFEYLTVEISEPTVGTIASNPTARKRVIAVRDNDSPPAPFWSLPSTTIREGETRTVTPEIVLSKRSETEVTVKLFVTGSAARNSDYNIDGLRSTRTIDNLFGNPILTKSFTFQPGEVRKRVNVEILDDGDYEGLERIFLRIDSGSGSPDILELPINDNESRPRKRQNDFQKFLGKVGDFFQDVGESVKRTYDPKTLFASVNAFDGYASGAKLFFDANLNQSQDFLDANGNGILDEGELLEPSVESDYDGQLVVPDLSEFDLNGNGFIDANEGQFVVRGGEDISTGGRFKVPLTAPIGYSVVSPLSTLVQTYATLNSADVNDAESQIASAFGLTDSGYLRGDLIQLASQGDLVAATAFGTSAQVYAVVTQVGEFVSGLSNGQVSIDIAGSLAFQDMVEKLSDPNGQLDLAEPFVIESIIRGVATRAGLESAPNESLQAAVNAIVELNTRIQALEVVDGREYVESVAKIQEIGNVELAEALGGLARGEITPNEITSGFIGDNLDSRIEALPVRNVVVPYIVSDDVTIVEGDSGVKFAEFNVGLTVASNLPVTVNYSTQSDSATEGEDYEATSGQLTWAAGDTTIQTIMVPILSDVNFEGNEIFQLAFTDPINAETLETLALASIVDDDAAFVTTDDVDAGTEYRLDTASGEVLLLAGDIVLFNGTLDQNAAFTIDASTAGPKDLFVGLQGDTALPADGILFIGDGSTSRLTIDAPTVVELRHVRTGLTSGYVDVDGQKIRYEGVVELINETAPVLLGLPVENPEVGDEFTLTATATNLDADVETDYQWNLVRNGEILMTGDEEEFLVSIEMSGNYSIEFSAVQEGRPTAITSYEFDVQIPAPVAVDDQFTVSEDELLIVESGNGVLVNDAFEGDQPITAINDEPLVGSQVTLASGALLTVQSDGSFQYDPRDAFNGLPQDELGTDSFTYTITAGEFSRSATVEFEIVGKNDPPQISLDPISEIDENDSAVITGSFTDPDGAGVHSLTVRWNDPNADVGEEVATFENLDVSSINAGDTIASLTDSTTMEVISVDAVGGKVEFKISGHVYLDDGVAPGNGTDSDSVQVSVAVQEGNVSTNSPVPNRLGSEFPINTYSTGNQRTAAFNGATNVATDAAGNFVVIWSSLDQDGSDWGLYGQRFSADGTEIDNEFQINTVTDKSQIYSAVAMDDDGGFIVTWSSFEQDGERWEVYAKVFDIDGDPIGDEFKVNTEVASDQIYPAIAMDQVGDFVITWSSNNQDESDWGVYGQRFDSNGAMIGGEFRINSETESSQIYQATAMDHAGNFVVTWSSLDQDGSDYGIYGQRFDQFGEALGSEFRINGFTTDKQTYSSVAMDQDSNFMVVWSSLGQDGSDWGVYGRRYHSDGSAMGGEFQINSFTDSAQIYPTIAMDADGNSVVTWSSLDQDGELWGIYGQRFDANGLRFGSEFQINAQTDLRQLYSSVALDRSGRVVVVWESEEQDGSSYGMFGQGFDFGQPPVTEFSSLVVQNTQPVIDIGTDETLTPDRFGAFNRTITFTDEGTLDSHSVTIDFGDGSELEVAELSSSDLRSLNLSHVYGEQGTFIVTITVEDDDLGLGMESFEVNVQLNDPPVALDDDVATDEESEVTINVLSDNGNGADFDEEENIRAASTVIVGEQPAKGILINNTDGTFTFDPNGEFESLAFGDSETVSFVYQIEDTFGEQSEATVTIAINGVNDSPIANDIEISVSENGPPQLILADFIDVDNDSTAIELDDSETVGTVTHNGNGQFTYDPDGKYETLAFGQSATDSFTYSVNDGNGGTSTATVTVTVEGQNDSPEITLDAIQPIEENQSVVLSGSFRDVDGEGIHTLTITWDDPNASANESTATFENLDISSISTGDTVTSSTDSTMLLVTNVQSDLGRVDFTVSGHVYLDDGISRPDGNGTPSDLSRIFAEIQEVNASPQSSGDDFEIDSAISDGFRYISTQAVASDADGNLIAVWADSERNGPTGVFGRYFDSSVKQWGEEFMINSSSNLNSSQPSVAMNDDGKFVVIWKVPMVGGSQVFGRRFDTDGTALESQEFQISSVGSAASLSDSVSIADDGSFSVAWTAFTNGSTEIFVRYYDSNGQSRNREFRANNVIAGQQRDPSIAIRPDGSYVVVWKDDNTITGKIIGSEGNLIVDEFAVIVEEDAVGYPVVTASSDGSFLVTWISLRNDFQDVYSRLYDSQGTPSGNEFRIRSEEPGIAFAPSAAFNESGNFVVTWTQVNSEEFGYQTRGRMFESSGVGIGGEFQINSDDEFWHVSSSVAFTNDSEFIVVWNKRDFDGDSQGIQSERFALQQDAKSVDLKVVNVAPQLDAGPDESLLPDKQGLLERTIAFSDQGTLDLHTITIDYGDGSGSEVINQNAGQMAIELDHTYDADGNYTVSITVEDDDLGSTTDTFEVNVQLNDPPVAVDDNIEVDEDSLFTFDVLADNGNGADFDAQNNIDLSLTQLISGPAKGNLTNNQDGTFTFDPNSEFESLARDESEVVSFIYQIEDSFGETSEATVTITIVGANDAPILSLSENEVAVKEGNVALNSGQFSDVDQSDTIALDASIGAVTDNGDGTWTWDYDGVDDLATTVVITASDGDGGDTSIEFDLTVENVAPTLEFDATDVVINEGDSTSKLISASDVPADTIHLTASTGTITSNGDGTWTWDYDGVDDLATTVVITAADEDGGETSIEFDLTVENVAPTLVFDTTDVVINEGDSTSKLITSTDVPADTIHLTASTGTITSNGDGTWTWDYDGVDDLATTVVITAADEDGGDTSIEFDLAVDNVAPTITLFNSSHNVVCESSADGSVRINGLFEDPGADIHTAIVDWGDGTIEVVSVNQLTKEFTGTHIYEQGGIFELTITVEDDDGSIGVVTTQAVSQGVGLVNGVLFVIGSESQDQVQLHYQSRDNLVWVLSSIGGSSRRWQSFDASQVTAIESYLCGGNDVYTSGGYRNSRYDVSIEQLVDGGDGNDRIYGGKGDDFLIGGDGHDLIAGYGGDDVIEGNAGNDWIFGGRGNDVLLGHAGNDYLVGGGGNDALSGGHGNDCLYGERGSDILIGGFGRDWIIGGSGADVIIGGTTSNSEDYESLQLAIISWSNRDEGETFEQLGEVIDDGVRDFLIGGRGPDTIEGGIGDWTC